ncbi:GNAT family N-acetyltransferase [Streptomyces sp. NPDC050610]|uniref:GNAT family N-acetyltransferase n=1 Tax=Streptomyces sp. NPDC050610 TaxID=3157097 RepID=UPI00341884E9
MDWNPMNGTPAVTRLARYTGSEFDEIRGDVVDPFEVKGSGLVWRPTEEHFGIRLDGRLVAHAGCVPVPLAVGGAGIRAIGVGSVIVAPGQRGRGLARSVVASAVEHGRGRGLEHGLLFCRPDRVPVYERLGWRLLEGDMRVEQPGGPIVMPLRSMWLPLREGAVWPGGPMRLLSLPM